MSEYLVIPAPDSKGWADWIASISVALEQSDIYVDGVLRGMLASLLSQPVLATKNNGEPARLDELVAVWNKVQDSDLLPNQNSRSLAGAVRVVRYGLPEPSKT